MKVVITYGTYDLFHRGHLELLRRAKALGDILIVGISTDEFNLKEKSKKSVYSYEKRKSLVEAVSFVDQVIPETCWEQKREDILRYNADIFVMGDDWAGHFDDLKKTGCEVVYLSRTPAISATEIKEKIQPGKDIPGAKPISCIVINRNGENYIETALQSLINQSLPPSEIIVADDASTDNSRELIEAYAEKYEIIHPIFRSKNLGASKNRDLAIREASCEWITTLDSDDWFNTEKLAAESRILVSNPGSVACSDTALHNPEKECFDIIHTSRLCNMNPAQRVAAITARKKMIPRDMLMARDTYESAGGMDHTLTMYEDWAFKIRLADQGISFVHSGVLGTAYFRSGTGLSGGGIIKHMRGKILALRSAKRKIKHSTAFSHGIINLFLLKGPKKLFSLHKPAHEIIQH